MPRKPTKSLNDHMKAKHLKEWVKMPANDTPKKSVIPQPKIEGFTSKPEKKSKEEVISRLALDNIPFSTISRREMMREYFKIGGIDLPKSHTTVQKIIVNHSNSKKTELILKISSLKESGRRFSLTFR